MLYSQSPAVLDPVPGGGVDWRGRRSLSQGIVARWLLPGQTSALSVDRPALCTPHEWSLGSASISVGPTGSPGSRAGLVPSVWD